MVWSVDTSGNRTGYGPYYAEVGYVARRLATSGDNSSRLLWQRYDRAAALWNLDANNSYSGGFVYGPY